MTKKGQKSVFCPGGLNFDPLFTIFQSPKNCKNSQKRANNSRFLALGGPNFAEFKKSLDSDFTNSCVLVSAAMPEPSGQKKAAVPAPASSATGIVPIFVTAAVAKWMNHVQE